MKRSTVTISIVMCFLVWGLYGEAGVQIARFITGNSNIKLADAGSWGDSFGAFNSLVTMIGSIAVVATIIQQSKAILIQERETHKDRFEASFFQLITLLRELRAEITFSHSKDYLSTRKSLTRKMYNGMDAIMAALYESVSYHKKSMDRGPLSPSDIAKVYYNTVHRRYEYGFSPYYRLIYTILRKIYVEESLSNKEKEQYGNILRSQLTSRELHMIAYNALHPVSKDLMYYLSYFHMFKYMHASDATRRIKGYLPAIAFESRPN